VFGRSYIYFLTLLTAFILLVGCSPQFHIKRAKKQQEKAIKKGAIFIPTNDTTFVTDTMYVTEFKNDTTYLTRYITHTNTIVQDGEVRYITKRDRRKEQQQVRRIYKDSIIIAKLKLRQNAKTQRTTVRAENRNRWWLWLLIGLVLGFLINFFYKNWFRVK